MFVSLRRSSKEMNLTCRVTRLLFRVAGPSDAWGTQSPVRYASRPRRCHLRNSTVLAAITSTSTLNSGLVKPDTIINVEAGGGCAT